MSKIRSILCYYIFLFKAAVQEKKWALQTLIYQRILNSFVFKGGIEWKTIDSLPSSNFNACRLSCIFLPILFAIIQVHNGSCDYYYDQVFMAF